MIISMTHARPVPDNVRLVKTRENLTLPILCSQYWSYSNSHIAPHSVSTLTNSNSLFVNRTNSIKSDQDVYRGT